MAQAIERYIKSEKGEIEKGKKDEKFSQEFFDDLPLYEYLAKQLRKEEKELLGKIKSD